MMVGKLTLKELVPIVAEYHAAFPDWEVVGKDRLVRFEAHIAQSIWFDRLRTGAYRPTVRIHVLVAPSEQGGTVVLSQFLNIKHREVSPQSHARYFSAILASLNNEIIPKLGAPLDENVVVELLKNQSKSRPANCYALACLLAARGNREEAVRCIADYRAAVSSLGLPPQPIDIERGDFLKKIESAPDARTVFEDVTKKQKMLLVEA